MARTDNFTNFATDVANSIREKTGETGLIPASEFDTKIKSIETEPNLQDKSITLTENGTTNIVADEGYDGLNNVDVTVNVEGGTPEIKPRYIHLIKDGVEQAGNTGGIQIRVTTGNDTQGQMFNGDGYLGLGAKIWSDAEFNIPNKFDLTEYTIAVVEWAYPNASSPYARQNAVAKLEINPYLSDNRETVMLTSNGATVARRKDIYTITKATGDDSIAFHLSNTFDTSSSTPVTAYPVQIFNLYLENPNATVQDKIVEINENGTTIVSPDEGYAALNSVEIVTNVSSSDYTIIEESVDFEGMSKVNTSVIQNGTTSSYSGWYLYDYIALDNTFELEYSNTPCYNSGGIYLYGIVFYNSNKQYISGIGFNEASDSEYNQNIGGYLISGIVKPPENAKYIRISTTTLNNISLIPEITLIKKMVNDTSNEIFSTEEVKTNKVWIDGKPIYRKVFETTFPTITHDYSSYSATRIDVSNLNIDTVVDLDGIITETNGTNFWTLNFYNHLAGASVVSAVTNEATTLAFTTNSMWLSTAPITAILEYTKTTDTATTTVEEE